MPVTLLCMLVEKSRLSFPEMVWRTSGKIDKKALKPQNQNTPLPSSTSFYTQLYWMGRIQITVMHILSKYAEVNTFMKQEFRSKHPMPINQLNIQASLFQIRFTVPADVKGPYWHGLPIQADVIWNASIKRQSALKYNEPKPCFSWSQLKSLPLPWESWDRVLGSFWGLLREKLSLFYHFCFCQRKAEGSVALSSVQRHKPESGFPHSPFAPPQGPVEWVSLHTYLCQLTDYPPTHTAIEMR